MLYPLTFHPLPVQRVWGGSALRRYGKPVPDGQRVGETWEISDRDEAQSVVVHGPLRGKTLRQVVESLKVDLLGSNCRSARFPLLVKLLDARERLSLQVHPPAAVAARLGGEPKTEMWYVLEADSGAGVIAGLRGGVTKQRFAEALESGSPALATRKSAIENLIHRLSTPPGTTIFIPSGRLHAIDAGLVLVEIQQNSDTTYRVHDWGRVGLDGNPRTLHVEQSLACIDFDDHEPAAAQPQVGRRGVNGLWRLIECEQFHVHRLDLANACPEFADGTTFHVLTGISGEAGVLTPDGKTEPLQPGGFVLIPAALGHYTIVPIADNTRVLKTTVPPAPAAAG